MKDVFTWEESFSVNNKAIDEQHSDLINTINEFMAITTDENRFLNELQFIKTKLNNYINRHFITEEKIMDNYAILEAHSVEHKKAHEEFKNWFKKTFDDNTITASNLNEALEYLIQWVLYHILDIDKFLFRQIELIKTGLTPLEAFKAGKEHNEATSQILLKALKNLYNIVLDKKNRLELANFNLEYTVKQRTAELEEANKRLESISLTDPLTGLSNRRYLEIMLVQIIETWKRYKTDFVVMFIDLDKFKKVNDTKGHETGDELLKWIADFLRKNFRKSDIVCRFGGDEFVIVCPKIDIHNAVHLAEKVLKNLKETMNVIHYDYWQPSLSIGLCSINEQNNSAETVLKKADKAMYKSKTEGGNRISTFP